MSHVRSRTAQFAGLLTLSVALASHALAQSAVITGRVTSDQGIPLPGANVYITELSLSVGTNNAGVFTISVPAARATGQTVQLRARSVGFTPGVRPVTLNAGSQTVNFELKTDVLRLSEVVVTGVAEGTERAKVPFAIGRITAQDLPVPALNPITALAGKVAGLRVAQTSGAPGSTPEILLRGPTSINGSGRGQGPLIIVDGAILNVGNMNELGGLDIESVEVVKGAAGASLYGTRAAAGVIVITTKRGASGSDGVRFGGRSEFGLTDLNSVNYGMPLNHQLQLDETGKRFCVAGSSNIAACSRTVDWTKEIMRVNNVNADTTRTPVSIQWNALTQAGELQNVFQSQIWPNQYYNILAQVLQRNPITVNQLDATGKIANVRFYVAGSYQNEQGAIRGYDGNQQTRARINLDYDARKDLTVSFSTLYDRGVNDNRGGGGNTIFGQALRGASIGTNFTARDTLGRYLVRSGGANLRSPTGNGGGTFLYPSENAYNISDTDRFLGSMTSRYTPAPWVTVEGTFAFDNRDRKNKNYQIKGYRTQTISTGTNNGNLEFDNLNTRSMNGSLSATLRRDRLFFDDLNARIQFRGQFDEVESRGNISSGEVFTIKDIYTTTNTTQNKIATSSSSEIQNVGTVVATTFDFKDRYTLEAYGRYDGSSLFGSGNRYAPYGRVSAVWQFSKEPFWNVGWMQDARVRASIGSAGTPPRFIAQYETYTINAAGQAVLGQAGNSELRPEVTTEVETGLDFTLFNRLGVEGTFARGTTRNQILPVNTPASLGFSTQWQNAGTMQNTTFELALNLPVIQRPNFSWSVRGTWDRTRTFITELFAPEYVSDAGTTQGTGSAFRITANPEKNNGWPQNRFGNIWGRKFYKNCSDLPTSVQSQCGEGKTFQRNDQGWLVYVGEGYTPRDGITKNLWQTYLPSAQSPWNVPLYWGHPIVDRPLRGQPGEGVGITQIIGNTLPDFRMQFANTIQYKRVSLYGLIDGTFGHDIINQGEGWGLLDLSSANFDQANESVETAKPVGYSWRAGPSESTGSGGFYDTLNPNNYVVENGSFAKLREVSLSYNAGRIRGVGDWTLGVIGRNLFTFTGYSGLDPEVGSTGGNNQAGSGLINQTDAFGFPTLRSFTFFVSTRF